jgi:hypothetical protein
VGHTQSEDLGNLGYGNVPNMLPKAVQLHWQAD